MVQQQSLWHDTLSEAVRAAVEALGGCKPVAASLWPSMPAQQAGRKLAHCLDDERAEKLSLDELDWIVREAREHGCHTIPGYLSRHGYQVTPVSKEDQADELKRDFVAAVAAAQELGKRLEALA